MTQQHQSISHKKSIAPVTFANSINSTQLKQKLKQKLNPIVNRMHHQSKQFPTTAKKQMNIKTQTKAKVERKDTLETKQTLADSNQLTIPIPNDDKIDQLIKRSEKDPFLKAKLKIILKNDLKGLMKLNHKNSVSETHMTQPQDDSKTSLSQPNSNEAIDIEYKHIPKDISMILNRSVLLKRKDICNLTLSEKPNSLSKNIFQDFTNEEQTLMINNQQALKPQFTTLRKENYKNKVARLQSLRSIGEKQQAITVMALSRFVDQVKAKNCGQIKRNNGTIEIRQTKPQQVRRQE